MRLFSAHIAESLIEELALFLGAGMHILPALKSLEEEAGESRTRTFMRTIRESVERGTPLWKALEEQRIFSSATVMLLKIGEQAGTLPEHMRLLAAIQEKNRVFRSRIMNAALYPTLVFGVALIVGGGIALFILPRLALVFGQLRVELPLITKILLAIGSLFGRVRIDILLMVVVATIGVVSFLFTRHRFRSWIQEVFFHLPGIERMIKEVEIGRFGYLCGTLLNAGVPILDVLQSVAESASLHGYRRLYGSLAQQLDDGIPLGQSLAHYPSSTRLIPQGVQGMIVAGEQTGLLPDTLAKIGTAYEAKGEATAKNLTTLLEPLLLLVVWFVVLIIAIAVILPIYSLIGEIQSR